MLSGSRLTYFDITLVRMNVIYKGVLENPTFWHCCFWSQVGVVFYICASHLCDRTWAEFQSIPTWLEGFSLATPVFLPLQNRLPVKNIRSECCAPGSCMIVWRQAEVLFVMHSTDPVWAAPFPIQPSGQQVRVISGHTILLLLWIWPR